MRSTATRLAAAALAAAIVFTGPALAATRGDIAAVWVPKHLNFVYQGLSTHYSCGGLRDEIAHLLSKLGPRHLEVRQLACARPIGPTSFPGVSAHMKVLVPADEATAKEKGPVVRAHWQEVVLVRADAGVNEQSKCELIEQFKQRLLPLFTTRDIRYSSSCFPHQASLFGSHLSLEVLMPNKKG